MFSLIKQRLREFQVYRTIRRSGRFDSERYLRQNLDVARDCMDPIKHYIRYGWQEGRNPSEFFDTEWYLRDYPDVAEKGVNPLYHYIKHGVKESRYNENEFGLSKKDLRFFGRHNIPYFENPDVSIVIPVFNQFHYTYKCILSIIRTVSVPYEIIVGDDCSNDMTCWIKSVFPGVKVVRSQINLGFLRNCNLAADHACGKYLMLLNNDTEVCSNAILELFELLEKNTDIGMAGAKLIYPDGRLQEAGGIIWRDGSGWNYGRFQDPSLSEFNYQKDVDYISGAGIMIRKFLWDQLGGFDDRFAPAYYEDTDLAFAVRQEGFRVVYSPRAEIIHHEGVSCGTNVSAGAKACQEENQKKFAEKWQLELESQLFPDSTMHLFSARDRSSGRTTIVFIDHYVPTFDQDCGSRSTFQYIQYFLKKGFNVKFIGDSSYRHEPYTSILEKMGVEVFRGPFNEQVQNWLIENNDHIDIVYLHRPHIAIKYIDFCRKNLKATLWYQCHDVHKIRIQRQHKIFNTRPDCGEQELMEQEAHCFKTAMVSFTFSSYEMNFLRKEYPGKKIISLPLYLFDDVPTLSTNFRERKDLLFVGGFAHPPNADAMLFFIKDVFGLVKKENPGIKLNIVGSNPPEELQCFAGDSVIIHGYVSDEQLWGFYDNTRLSVVPLRYGAGVKGKVLESMYYGVPVIGTSIAWEGISDLPGELAASCETPVEIARAITELYNDEERWGWVSGESQMYIKNNYSVEALEASLLSSMSFIDSARYSNLSL